MELIDRIKVEASKLKSYSAMRMPYTYHHDFMIANNPKYMYKSRSDVAEDFSSADLQDVYAVAFVYLISISDQIELASLGIDSISSISALLSDCAYAVKDLKEICK